MQQWLNDPKNRPLVIGGAIAVVVIAVVAVLLFMGGGSQQTTPTQTTTAPVGGPSREELEGDYGVPTTGAPPMAGGPRGGMGMPGMGGMPRPGMGAQQAAQVPAGNPPSRYRVDPFKPLPWEADVSKPPILSVVTPVRLQPLPTPRVREEEQEDILPPQPYRRVAGIMWGQSVAAIIETQGDLPRVVKPGDTIDGLRVARIEPNQVVLSTLGRKPQEISVKLGAPITPVQRAFPGAGGVPGAGGIPGVPPGGFPGGGAMEDY
ncbi:MAG: hypothetical protein NZ520_00125 [bacterium]|nr:hypothetical protein [bacterium]